MTDLSKLSEAIRQRAERHRQREAFLEAVAAMKTCSVCHNKKYVISTRSDGYDAVEACDNCITYNLGDVLYCSSLSRDVAAAQLAARDGIAALHDYPCYVIGKIIRA